MNNPAPYTVLTENQLNNVEKLNNIKKAIYIMASNIDQNHYRFGGIGVKSANTAIRRLGQCTSIINGGVLQTWRNFMMAEFPSNISHLIIRNYEISLKNSLIGKNGAFCDLKVGKADAFRSSKRDLIKKIFNQSLKNHNIEI